MTDITHILKTDDEDSLIWEMYCRDQVIVFDDGSTAPYIDFYDKAWWFQATCKKCKAYFALTHLSDSEIMKLIAPLTKEQVEEYKRLILELW